jgi:protein subunit release factor A
MIDKKDIKVTYTKGSGPGGQHKNKTETCVTITHIPTGISETCQETRSKTRNYNIAFERISERVDAIQKEKRRESINEHRKSQINDKTTLRTYNYKRNTVKDHSTGKVAPLDKVMNGEINLLK